MTLNSLMWLLSVVLVVMVPIWQLCKHIIPLVIHPLHHLLLCEILLLYYWNITALKEHYPLFFLPFVPKLFSQYEYEL